MDQQLGRAFNAEIVRREIEAITDLGSAKRAALLLLQQIEIQRQMMDVLIKTTGSTRMRSRATASSRL